MRRRAWLQAAGWVGLAVAVPVGAGGGLLYARAGNSNVGSLDFTHPLRIPPLLDPEPGPAPGNRLRFRLTAQAGEADLLPHASTPTWGYNGAYLGPTIRVRPGERVAVDVVNQLSEQTTTHWHGMHLPAVMDGGPHQPIEPGDTWSPEWTVNQSPATLWYHPHLHRTTAAHVYRGLAGLFLVEDADPALPHEYGVDDIPLVVQDRKFHADGSLDTSGLAFQGLSLTGLLGDTILVNGTFDPYLDVTREWTRFRVLNGSNARVYDIGFADDREFHVVGTDAGRLPEPRPARRVMLSPGERAEILVRFTPGERVVLRSFPPPLGANWLYERLAGGDDTFDLLLIRAGTDLVPGPPPPSQLAAPEPIPAGEATTTREFTLGDFTIDGQTMDHDRIDHVAPAGGVEIWQVTNAGGPPANGLPHNFHIHGVDFEVMEIDGEPPPPALRGHRDTVYVPPRTTVRLAVRFGAHSDPHHPYMYHCHFLAHEDAGMMGQFLVVSERDRGMVPGHEGHS